MKTTEIYYNIGDSVWINEEEYIIARVKENKAKLICLKDGNRYDDTPLYVSNIGRYKDGVKREDLDNYINEPYKVERS